MQGIFGESVRVTADALHDERRAVRPLRAVGERRVKRRVKKAGSTAAVLRSTESKAYAGHLEIECIRRDESTQ